MQTDFKLFEWTVPPSGSFIVEVDDTDYNPKTRTFSFEASSKRIAPGVTPPGIVYLKFKEKFGGEPILKNWKGDYMKFFKYKVDTEGEDIFGWRYRNEYSIYNLLIIND